MMDDWTKKFFAFCDAVSQEIEVFFTEIINFTEEIPQAFEEASQELEETFTEEMEIFFQDWEELFTILISDVDWLEEEEEDNSEFFIHSKVYPDEETHPACQGCRHYHGYIYGGELFVCAMHPYGWEDENCPDWEEDNE